MVNKAFAMVEIKLGFRRKHLQDQIQKQIALEYINLKLRRDE